MKKLSIFILALICVMSSCAGDDDVNESVDEKQYAIKFNVSRFTQELEPMGSDTDSLLKSSQTKAAGNMDGFHVIEAAFYTENGTHVKSVESKYMKSYDEANPDFGSLNVLLSPGKYKGIICATKNQYPLQNLSKGVLGGSSSFEQVSLKAESTYIDDVQLKVIEFEVGKSDEDPSVEVSLERIVSQIKYVNTDTHFPSNITGVRITVKSSSYYYPGTNSYTSLLEQPSLSMQTSKETVYNSYFIHPDDGCTIQIYKDIYNVGSSLAAEFKNVKIPIGKRLVLKGALFEDADAQRDKNISIQPDNTEWTEEEMIIQFY